MERSWAEITAIFNSEVSGHPGIRLYQDVGTDAYGGHTIIVTYYGPYHPSLDPRLTLTTVYNKVV